MQCDSTVAAEHGFNKQFRLKRIAAAQKYGRSAPFGRVPGPTSAPLSGTGNAAQEPSAFSFFRRATCEEGEASPDEPKSQKIALLYYITAADRATIIEGESASRLKIEFRPKQAETG